MGLMNKGIPILLAGVVVLFLAGLFRLFELCFEEGEVYPPYSSLRSDPLGGRALYGAMQSLEGVSVSRNLESLLRLPEGRDKTLLLCGGNLSEDPVDLIKALEDFAADGGRLVITFFPVRDEPAYRLSNGDESEEAKKKSSTEQDKDTDEDSDGQQEREEQREDERKQPWFTQMVSIEDRWGFSFAFLRPPHSNEGDYLEVAATKQEGVNGLPPSLSWHSALYFDKLADSWKVLYSWNKHGVIMQRPWVRGTIVLCSDSYFLSNEAMRIERHPQLLAWLVGPSSSVIFDETHFGIRQPRGTMTLVRKYRLDRPLAVLILLALLFVWKNSVSLVPKQPSSASEGPASGRDSTAGLVNLLRRSIPTHRILPVCVEEWKRSLLHDPKAAGKQKRIQKVVDRDSTLPSKERSPVEAYRKICAILAERD